MLSKENTGLPSDVTAMYIQSAAKIFGAWAAGLASNWDEDDLPELKGKVSSIIAGLQHFAGDANFEIQERVC